MLVAVVDDDQVMRNQVKYYLEDILDDYKIDLYCSGNELLQSHVHYDIVILDVEMNNGDGIYTKNILMNSYQPLIIFISNYKDKVLDAFGVNVIAYLDKHDIHLKDELKHYIHSYISSKYLTIDNENIKLNDIYYLEASGSYTIIHTLKKEYMIRKNLKDISLDPSFYRIHKSYIINFKYLKDTTHLKVILLNKKELNISRGTVNKIKEAYASYLRSQQC